MSIRSYFTISKSPECFAYHIRRQVASSHGRGVRNPRRGTFVACDTDSIFVVASPKGGMVSGARRSLLEVEGNMNIEATKPIPSLSHDTVKKIARRFRSLNPCSFGGDLLKIEDINYKPDKKGTSTNELRTIHVFSISSKRYSMRGEQNC
jgi:hypothetical protein